MTNLRKSVPSRNRGLVDGKRCGSLEADLRGQLDELHFAKTKFKKDAWKADMQDLSKASAWVKQSQPPPFLLQKEDGTVVAGQAAGLQALFPFWAKVFGRDDVSEDPRKFLAEYAEELPEMRPEATWQPLCPSELRRAAATMVNKAEGPDGVSAQALLSLPPAAWDRFAQLLCRFEHRSLAGCGPPLACAVPAKKLLGGN